MLILLMGLSIVGTAFAEEPIINATASKTVNDHEVNLGEDIIFNLTVTNPNLDDNFKGMVVTDVISDMVTYVGNSDPNKAIYDQATRTLTWNIGNLNAGEVAKLVIYTKAAKIGKFNNEFNGTYNVTVVDQPASDESVLVGYQRVITGWTGYEFEGTYSEANAWLNNMKETYPLSEYPDAIFSDPYQTCSCLWHAAACIPTYICDPIYECIHHPATYKNETRYLHAAIDPGTILGLPESNAEEPTVSAATVDMQKTGAPILGTILALLLLTAGMFLSQRKP
jgi:uncharacterized repeat protein (TIGR01451 family)